MDRTLKAITIAAAACSFALFVTAALIALDGGGSEAQSGAAADPTATGRLIPFAIDSDSKVPPNWPSGIPTPDPELVRQADEAFERVMQEALNAETSEVEINGQIVPLPPGFQERLMCVSEGGGCATTLTYTSPHDGGSSWVSIREGKIVAQNVRPEDVVAFEGIVASAGVLPSATPTMIRGSTVQLPNGMTYSEAIWHADRKRKAYVLAYVDADHDISRLYLDDVGEIISNQILPEHSAVYQDVIGVVAD
jgi:hypothetical protein